MEKANFKDVSVLVLPGAMSGDIIRMFARHGAVMAKELEETDLLVFSGGSDVNPALYGERPHRTTTWDTKRDEFEKGMFEKALALGIPMTGICRGSQFLNVMNGGKLWQDVDGHCNYHSITDIHTGKTLIASSTHHQMMRINGSMNVIAVATEQVSKRFEADSLAVNITKNSNRSAEIEIEACSYEDTKCFLCQGHPEMGPSEFTDWYMKWLEVKMMRWSGASNTPEQLPHIPIRALTEEEKS